MLRKHYSFVLYIVKNTIRLKNSISVNEGAALNCYLHDFSKQCG